jgi:hypothetical protein
LEDDQEEEATTMTPADDQEVLACISEAREASGEAQRWEQRHVDLRGEVKVEMRNVLELVGQCYGLRWPARHDDGDVLALQVSAELGSLQRLVEVCHCYR